MSAGIIRIVIAQRGWVFVGVVSREEHEIVIRRARSIRRWGTSKGLGELRNGPKNATQLDEAGTVRLHPLMVIAQIEVNPEKWDAHLDR